MSAAEIAYVVVGALMLAVSLTVLVAVAHRKWIGANVTTSQWAMTFLFASTFTAVGVFDISLALSGRLA